METVAASQVGPGGCFVSCGGMPSSTRLPACADVGAGRQGCQLHARLPASCHANATSGTHVSPTSSALSCNPQAITASPSAFLAYLQVLTALASGEKGARSMYMQVRTVWQQLGSLQNEGGPKGQE